MESTREWLKFFWGLVLYVPTNIYHGVKCIHCYVAHKKYHDGHFSFVEAGECTCSKCGYHWDNPPCYM